MVSDDFVKTTDLVAKAQDPDAQVEILKAALGRVTPDVATRSIGEAFANLDVTTQQSVASRSLRTIASKDRNAALSAVSSAGLPPPSQPVGDRLWFVIVATLAVISVGAATGVILAYFVPQGAKDASQIVLLFTTAMAGLIGLFAPSPLGKSNST